MDLTIKALIRVVTFPLGIAFAVFLAAFAPSQVQAAVPSQFIAKQYTEALGRAPDASAWQAYTNYFNANGCNQGTLSYMTGQIFGSAEYTSKGYTPREQVLTIYRAVLSREPDQSGFDNWVIQIQNGMTAATMAQQFTQSAEFTNLIKNDNICTGNAYRQDWAQTWPLDINQLGFWTDVNLQACVNNNVVCTLRAGQVVQMYNTVTIPAGHTLQTEGNPDRRMYARQARIVRYSGNFGHLLQAGGISGSGTNTTIQNIWVDGSGNYYPPSPTDHSVKANIRFESLGAGYYGLIQSVRSDFPYQATNIETGAPNNVGLVAVPGTIDVKNNLTVGYASHHTSTNGAYPWADGVSQHVANGAVQGNDIVDPTDVGIVLFGQVNQVQASTASGNIIVHAGLSAFGSAGLDTTQCTGAPSASNCAFSGTGITNNTIFAGQQQRVDIVLFNGTGPWWLTPNNSCSTQWCGTGGQISNNNTIMNDSLQTMTVMQSTIQDAMLNAITSNNQLNISRQPYGKCYNTPAVACINQY